MDYWLTEGVNNKENTLSLIVLHTFQPKIVGIAQGLVGVICHRPVTGLVHCKQYTLVLK